MTTATATARREAPSTVVVGAVVWISSELLFFGSLFGAYFALRSGSEGPWPPQDAHLERWAGAIGTVLLVVSSLTVHQAAVVARTEDVVGVRKWLLATMALGAAFLGLLVYEWSVLPFSVDSHAFGTMFYTLTGFHGLHVLAGLIAMGLMVWRTYTGSVRESAVEVMSYYWHFVDVVWIALFSSVYPAG